MTQNGNGSKAWRDWDGALRIPATWTLALFVAVLGGMGTGLKWTWDLASQVNHSVWRLESLEAQAVVTRADHESINEIKTMIMRLGDKVEALRSDVTDAIKSR